MSTRVSYYILLVLACAGGLVVGFAYGLYAPWSFSTFETFRVNVAARFDSSSHDPVVMDGGWGKREAWGTPMRKPTASVTLGFDGPSAGDVELLVEARLEGHEDSRVIVQYNGVELGRWFLSPNWHLWRRRFTIPQAVFNRRMDGTLSFASVAGKNGGFGIEGITLRDASGLGVYKGFLDRCTPKLLSGWAVAQDIPTDVTATVDGRALRAVFTNVHRPDLEAHGIPSDAGFELTTDEPIAKGSRIEVRFANGRSLNGSPCRL